MKKAIFLYFVCIKILADDWTCEAWPELCGGIPDKPIEEDNGFSFSKALGDHMVLQRDVLARVWGSGADPNSMVTIKISGGAGVEQQQVKAEVNGTWSCDLRKRPATLEPSNITAISSKQEQIMLQDVLFGDVWGCHGQSNMQFSLKQDHNATAECAVLKNFPHIRFMSFSKGIIPWSLPSAATGCQSNFGPFSAVCWYFGKNLYLSLKGTVPIGLAGSYISGTSMERWAGPDAIAKCNQTGVESPKSGLWNYGIVPLLNMQLSGWTWYQGESNVAANRNWQCHKGMNCCIGCNKTDNDANRTACGEYYACQFPAMIEDWKAKFNGGTTMIGGTRQRPFLFVELAPYTEGANDTIKYIRDAQLSGLELKNTAMASAIDYGDRAAHAGDIHPSYKTPVGLRLAWAARAIAYGEKIPYRPPRPVKCQVGANQITIRFDFPVEIRDPTKGRKLDPSNWPCPSDIPEWHCGYLTVNSVRQTAMTVTSGALILQNVPKANMYEVEYLRADWPVPFLYLANSGDPGIPASTFKLQCTV